MATSEQNNSRLLQDFSRRTAVTNSFPAVMYIEATKGCPYTCIMCNVPEKYGRKSVDIEQGLLDKVSPYFKYLELLAIHGNGEPLLSRNMDFFIRASLDHNFFLHMNTTGFFLNRHLADRLCAAKLSIRFSIHAGTEESYQRIMGDNFDLVMRNISYLIEKNRQVGIGESDFWFSFIVMKENINEIEDFLRLSNRVGITKVRFMALNPRKKTIKGARRDELDFNFNHFEQINGKVTAIFLDRLPKIKDLARELGITIESGSMEAMARLRAPAKVFANHLFQKVFPGKSVFPLVKRRGACMAPWTGQVHVHQDGDVQLCCSTNYSLGNLYDKDFGEIWNDYKMRDIRSDFSKGMFPRACGYCRGIGPNEYPIDFFNEIAPTEPFYSSGQHSPHHFQLK